MALNLCKEENNLVNIILEPNERVLIRAVVSAKLWPGVVQLKAQGWSSRSETGSQISICSVLYLHKQSNVELSEGLSSG